MSAHRRIRPARTKLRRTITAGVLAVTSGLGFLAAAGPAAAAGPWFVANTGINNASCGLSAGTPCNTVAYVMTKGAFLDGDTINLAAGTYGSILFQAKTANVVGPNSGTASINGGAANFAVGVNITNAKTLRLTNVTLTNGRSANGGGLTIAAGQVITNNVIIQNSTGTTTSGGAYIPAGGSLTMTGGSVTGNNGGLGGGIYNLGTLSADGTNFSFNTTTYGGAIASAGTVTLVNSNVNNNTASVQGGGIYNNTGNVTLNNTPVGKNTAGAGGGVFQQAGSTTITNGSSVFDNKATAGTSGNGGGIHQVAGTTNVSGLASVSSNTATNQGGGIYSAAGNLVTNNASVNGNNAAVLGGGVSVISGTATLLGGQLTGNRSLNGGALYNGATTTIDGTTLNVNTADGGATANGGNGGAIYNSAALTVRNATFNANKTILNTATAPGITGYGGAIVSTALAAAATPSLTFTDTTINGDNSGSPVAGGNANAGGAIAALGNIGAGGAATSITATGLTLSKNLAAAGGGIFSTGPVTLTGSTLTQNKATHASAGIGGGIYATPQPGTTPTLTLDDTDVLGNDGVAGGGGIVTTISTVVKDGSKVNGNTGALGAGIYTSAPVSVTGSQVNDNSAANSGGGIYTGAPVTVSGSSLDGNSAAFLGGAFATTATAGSLAMTGGSMSGNDAFGAGGAFIGNGLVASFDGTDLVGNTATGANFGGGAILSGGKVTIDKAQISDNKADGASGLGGAIFSGSNDPNVTTSLKITGSTLSGNEAFSGSALLIGSENASSTNKTSIASSTIHGNKATGPFGAIQTTEPVSIVASTVTDNTAVPTSPFDAYGGIVAQGAGQVSLSGSVLAGNTGHQCNVAVADGGFNLNSPTASECAFSTAPAKGNVFAAPQLGELADNGGPTTTRLPSPTSPALDRITGSAATGVNDAITGSPITLCTGTDQRGVNRPQGARCDIGAVEAEQVVPVLTGPASATYSVGIAGAPQVFTATGSPQPTLSATGLPNGVTFTDNGNGTGTLAGTPGAGTGGVHAISVKATNEAGSDTEVLTLTINQAPELAGPSAATYTVGQPGGPSTFTSTGHPTPVLSSIGVLPAGVGFADNGDGTGAYSGTPGAGTGGVYNLTVKGANGTPPDATAPFALTVNEAAGLTGPGSATFKVGTASQSGEYVGTGFPVPNLSATGLPSGLSLVGTGAGKGRISGTAANGTGGVHPVTVTATNGVGSPAEQDVSVTVNEAPELVGPTEARFVTGTASSIGFSSDGFPQATLTRTGALPPGLSFVDNGNGSATISGTATTVGTYPVTVTASNGQSPDATITVQIEVVPPLSISTTSLPDAAYRTAYSAQVTASGGQPGYTFEVVSGSLPAGLSMNQFGLITGSATAAAGTHTFTVKATDSLDPAQTATKQLSITLVKGNTHLDVTAIVSGVQPNGDISLNVGLVEADIKGGFPLMPVAGLTVKFTTGSKTVCTAVSDAAGHAQCSQNLLDAILTPLKGSLTATFAGNTVWNGSTATAGVFKAGSSSSSGGGGNLLSVLLGGG